MKKDLRKAVEVDEGASQLLRSLRDLIQNARQRALRAVDAVQVQTCWRSDVISSNSNRAAPPGRSMEQGCCRA